MFQPTPRQPNGRMWRVTPKMLALKALFDYGDCTLDQVGEVLEIPAGRAFAVLAALVRDGDAVKERHQGGARYLPTEAGKEKVRLRDAARDA